MGLIKYKKTILITGGAGFIGSNYLNKFVPAYPDYFFVNIDLLTYAADLRNIRVQNEQNYAFEKLDIRKKSELERIFDKHQPTDIIHFAAESHVDFSIKDPSIFVETNVLGTHNLLLLAEKHNINRFHQISTDEVYGALRSDEPPFNTRSSLAPNSPYSASKASADMLVRSYNKTFGLDTVITRCSNNYGPNQDGSKLIPKAILNLLNEKKVPVYGTGENVRDWIYVEDHVDAIDLIFHKGTGGKVYNIGGKTELKNIDIVRKLVAQIKNNENDWILFVEDRKGHDYRYAIDNSEIEKEFGWQPKVTLKEGLQKTVDFYRKQSYA